MTVKYKTLITTAGAAKFAAATAGGTKITITQMAVGDGGGTLPVPDVAQTKLIREKWRAALNKISVDAKKKNYVIAELVIPPEVGGFWLREMGLYDADGTLVAVANMAESYKPELAEGSGRAQTLRMVIIVSAVESVDLVIDTTMVMATQDYVDDKIAEHEQSRRHPDASLTAKGLARLSSATDSASEVLAATPKAVKAANDNASGRVPSERKINGRALSTDISLDAADVGALPVVGGRLKGNVEIYAPAPTIQLTDTDTGKKFYISSFKSGFRINEDSSSGNAVLLYNGDSKILSSVGQIVPGNSANFDAKYQPKGSYTPAGEAYTKAASDGRYILADSVNNAGFVSNDATNPYFRHKSSNTVISLATRSYTYSKAESDGRFQAKGSYTPAGEAYKKAESDGRYQPKGSYTPAGEAYTKAVSDGRYPLKTATVTQIRLGAQTQHGTGDYLQNFQAASTRVFTGKGSENGQGDARRQWWYTRPLQVLINGAWVAASANG